MSYLYFVLPPVIIVASLALIIFLIFRKSLEIEKMILKNEKKESDSKLVVNAKAKGLHLLERMSHWFKIFSLKFHNWNENKLKILKRKKTEVNVAKEKLARKENKRRIIPVARKIDIQVSKREQKEIQARQKARKIERLGMKGAMVSEKAVHPDNIRKELEEALIERIAADPRDIEAYERLGDYYISQNSPIDAQACYKQVLKLNPQNLTVRGKLDRLNK
jgi:tetratricopeptide (TPR) repeat protein